MGIIGEWAIQSYFDFGGIGYATHSLWNDQWIYGSHHT